MNTALYSTFDFWGFYGKSSRLFHSLGSWQVGRWNRRGSSPLGTFSPSANSTWLSHKQSEWGLNLLRYSSGRPTNKKSVANSLHMAAAYITFECSLIPLTSNNINIQKSNNADLLPKCCHVNGHVMRVKSICISET